MNEENGGFHSKRAFRPQVLLFCAAFFVGTSYGMSMGHSSVLLPLLQADNSTLVIDEETGSWIASVYAISAPLGSILCGISMDFWGRRRLNMLGSAGMVFGWLMITFAQNALTVISGRILEGLSRSILATATTVLIDELASPRYRGCIVCGLFTSVTAGILLISLLGAFLHWRTASGLAALVSSITILVFYFISESPTWFVKRNRRYDAQRALKWLWGSENHLQVTEELSELATRLQPEEQTKYFECRILKPLLILHVYNILQNFCGLGLFTYYTVDFVSKIRTHEYQILDDYSTTIVISVIRFIVTIAASFLMLTLGRRTISLISSTCSSIFAITLSALLFYRTGNPTTEKVEACIMFTLVILYVASMSFGLFMLPSIMIGETQSSHIRGFSCGYIYAMNDLVLGAIVKLYPWLSANLQIHGLFLMFGVSCVVCSIFVHLFLPETQGLTLQQIEDYFQQPNVMWITRNQAIKQTEEIKENINV